MPYISKAMICTDQNPVSKHWNGQILELTDPAARYLIVGTGCILSDRDAIEFGLTNHPSLIRYDPAEVARTREQAVLQRTADLAAIRSGAGEDATPEPQKPPSPRATKKRK